jgi:AcrR family transcriptional regulator
MDKKAVLLKCAKKLFSENGYKNTNIARITKLAEMATGTFYNYYSSKDGIFMDIYIEENKKLKEKLMKSINLDDNPMEVIKQLTKMNYQGMIANPILKEWYNRELFIKIEETFKKEKGLDKVDFFYDSIIDVVKYWQENGKMRKDISPEMIMAIFTAIINVDLHKEEIGIDYFPDLLMHLSTFTMEGLMDVSK